MRHRVVHRHRCRLNQKSPNSSEAVTRVRRLPDSVTLARPPATSSVDGVPHFAADEQVRPVHVVHACLQGFRLALAFEFIAALGDLGVRSPLPRRSAKRPGRAHVGAVRKLALVHQMRAARCTLCGTSEAPRSSRRRRTGTCPPGRGCDPVAFTGSTMTRVRPRAPYTAPQEPHSMQGAWIAVAAEVAAVYSTRTLGGLTVIDLCPSCTRTGRCRAAASHRAASRCSNARPCRPAGSRSSRCIWLESNTNTFMGILLLLEPASCSILTPVSLNARPNASGYCFASSNTSTFSKSTK